MAKFYVGQRVRILWSPGWPELAGKEGRVLGSGRIDLGPYAGSTGYDVAPDCWGSSFAPRRSFHGAMRFTAAASQLEPILDQKHEACDEDFKRDLDRLLERQGVSA